MNSKVQELINKKKINNESFLFLVDDGSTDNTWEIIKKLKTQYQRIKALKLSKNFGHQNAILAGMMNVKDISDITITIDADLQDDENTMETFIDKHHEGYDIVFGARKERKTDSLPKKLTADIFYNLIELLGISIVKNSADYRLVSRKVLLALNDYKEINLFLRGIFPSIGFKSTIVTYSRHKRLAGESKYTISKMFLLAINGITSFSTVPLRIITFLGLIIFLFSLIMGLYVLYTHHMGYTIRGWTSTLIPIYFIGGVQLFCLGIIGEYIGKIYSEVKRRPRYIIEEEI